MDSLHFEGTDMLLCIENIDLAMLEELVAIGGPGEQTRNVANFMERWTVEGNVEDCKRYLKSYGAWDDEELSDHDLNLSRLVWLTGGAFAEGEPAYFSIY